MKKRVRELSDTGLWVMGAAMRFILFYERLQWAFAAWSDAPHDRYHWIGQSHLRAAMISMIMYLFSEAQQVID